MLKFIYIQYNAFNIKTRRAREGPISVLESASKMIPKSHITISDEKTFSDQLINKNNNNRCTRCNFFIDCQVFQ